MSVSLNPNLPANQLLAALPVEEYQRLAPHLKLVSLSQQQILYNMGEAIEYAYFPNQALISLVSLLEDGSTTEVGIIGKDGMIGLPACWGGDSTNIQAIVQVPGDAMQMKAQVLKTEFCRGGTLQRMLLLYTQALFTQVAQSVACNRHHTIEQRLARWLLIVQDQIYSEELSLTQEFISQMLGTRRSGITVAAINLQQAGTIRYSRGKITIVDREKLKSFACECYGIVKREFVRLLSTSGDRIS
jgi:CRP-like cAMP-binding protein